MKILHYQSMGVGAILAQEQRKLGHEARVLVSSSHPFGFKEDYVLPSWGKHLEWKKHFHFDILHNHDPETLPITVEKNWNGNIVQHYHNAHMDKPQYGAEIPSLASIPSILDRVPWATWLPLPAETELFSPDKRVEHDDVNIGSCQQSNDPAKAQYIPTSEVRKAVNLGRDHNPPTRSYAQKGVMPHEEMCSYYGMLDIWVDRIGLGFYGFATIEVASMGIPAIVQVDEGSQTFIEDCPFYMINSKEEVIDAILTLAQDESLRKEMGRKGRDFILQYHDSKRVAQKAIEFYEGML